MKRFSLIIILLTFSLSIFSKEYKVYGPQGGLAMEAESKQMKAAELIVVEGENHMITRKLKTVVSHAVLRSASAPVHATDCHICPGSVAEPKPAIST